MVCVDPKDLPEPPRIERAAGTRFQLNSPDKPARFDSRYGKGVLFDFGSETVVIRESARILPIFLIHVSIEDVPELYLLPLCENCEEKAATVYCIADAAYLCDSCDASLHSENRLVARHVRVPVVERPGRSPGRCATCGQDAEWWCMDCELAICNNCRNHGTHSVGEARAHNVLTLREGSAAARAHASGADAVITLEQTRVVKKLEEIQIKRGEIDSAGSRVEERAYQVVSETVAHCRDILASNAKQIQCDEVELARELHEIDWAERFMQYIVETAPPIDLLGAWVSHGRMREYLTNCRKSNKIVDDMPPLRLYGELSVGLPASAATPSMTL
jgi:hypothetical protein